MTAVISAFVAAQAQADEKLHYAPAEAWVQPEEVAKPDAAYADAPAQILLQSIQLKFDADGSATYYTEFAVRIQTTVGLQFAQSHISWNPATEVATINKVHILRGPQVIDVLAKGQTFTTLRREQNLDKAMLDGYLTGVLQPEGLQVGDIVVVGTSIKRRDPVFAGRAASILTNLSMVPSARQSVRATWDASAPVQWRQSDDLKGKIVKNGASETYFLERSKIIKAETQDSAPVRFNLKGYVEFSQFKTWNEISSLLAPLYTQAATLPADSAVHKEIAKIRAASNDPKVQAAMALNLVQNQVRYVFLGMNLGGYVPADADATWQRRFGDCKGKTALLLAILRELGIKAEAAAVNSGGGDGLDERLPSIEMFDHVIVRTEIDGKVYWMDGTRLGDRDLNSLKPPYVRWALPMTTAGTGLEAVPMLPPEQPTEDLFIRFDTSSGLDVPARARIEKILRGDLAVQFDAAFKAVPTGERDNALKAYWSEQYDWIEPRKVSATFDPTTGEAKVTMDGTAAMTWDESKDGQSWRYETDIMSVGWAYGVEREKGPHKLAPYFINFPYYYRTRQEIILPKGGKGFTVEGAPVDKTLGGSEFKRLVSLKDGVLTLEASKRALVPEISYKDAQSAAPLLMELWNKDVWLIAPKSYRKSTSAKPTVAVSGGKDADAIDDLIEQANIHIQQDKTDEALRLLNKALRLDPNHVAALQGRASIFMMRGNLTAAMTDLEMALKTDPKQWNIYNGIGLIQQELNNRDKAVEAFTQALTIYPNDLYALENRARAYLAQRDLDKARQDADTLADLGGEPSDVVDLRVSIALAAQNRDEAKTVIQDAIAANPDDTDLQTKLANFLADCQYLDAKACDASKIEAVAAYDAAIALKPTPDSYSGRAMARPKTDLTKALEDADAAIALEPGESWPLLTKAELYMDNKAYDKALPLLEQALTLSPKDINSRDMLADLYLTTGRKEQGLAELERLKRDNPKLGWAFNLSCWSRATHNIELETALKDCNTGLELLPNSVGILDSRGFTKLRLGQLDDAIADYDEALKLEPELAESLYGRGLAKLQKGDKAGADTDLIAARKISHLIDQDFAEYGLKP
ncbi:tetratricopeptide repeat protein [Asticcacaulis machinosus]|uniref:Tetratricopeptide repeat protein n=1 Tax=Asticcacaulis machinosus TaxID=2984211 RepID=A0ABT5HMX8_9CAUL|nr:tetratricopeptide repeat protein [Asticcacaulis machinosus]MDC7677501.1 tetratricopeptide repeat protein [Asticcacaulis machinosus]